MPIHVRAEPGDYAEACLLPGDPLRAKYIAETYFDDVQQRNSERGLLGYTGTWEGKPISVQGTGMGCPGATIVFEELVQLGVKKLLRVGTCGGLQPHHALGDMIVALSAVPADSTAMHLVANEPHCPTASWELIHGAVHAAKELGQDMHVGPIVSSDLFYNPDEGQYERWSKRGVLAVEMEAAALFTVGALRGVEAGCLLTVSDIVVEGEFTRISDDDLRAAVDRMTRVALATATDRSLATRSSSSTRRRQRRHRQALARDRPPRRRRAGSRATRSSRSAPGHLTTLAREAALGGAKLLVVVGGDGSVNEVANGIHDLTEPEVAVIPRGTGWDFVRTYGIPHKLDGAIDVAREGRTRVVDLGRALYRAWDGSDAEAYFANVASAGMSGAIAERANQTTKALGGKVVVPLGDGRGLLTLAELRDPALRRRRDPRRADARRRRRERALLRRRHADLP